MQKPTYTQLTETLASLIGAFSDIDALLDNYMSQCDASKSESRISKAANRIHTKSINTLRSVLSPRNSKIVHLALNPEAHATILAALRFYQSKGIGQLSEIATNGGAFAALDEDDIDSLCESIN